MSISSKKIVMISKALADANRFKIFKMISKKGEISCKNITSYFNLSQPTISHHLKILMESGLIEARKEGQWGFFSVNRETLNVYLSSLEQHVK